MMSTVHRHFYESAYEKAHLLKFGFCRAPKSSGTVDRAITKRSAVIGARLTPRRIPEDES
jgi:hypothetical protein